MFWEFHRVPSAEELDNLDEIEAYYKNSDPKAYYEYIQNIPINKPYAVTNRKSIANEFMKTRDMRRFKVIVKDLDTDDITALFESDPEYMIGCRLDKYKLITAKSNCHTEYTKVSVVMTTAEHDALTLEQANSKAIDILDFDWWYNTDVYKQALSPYLFKPKYGEALNLLCMDKFSKHPYAHEPESILDELNIFIQLYSHLLK